MLTEPSRFDGDLAHLEEVADAMPATPFMRKDFLVDPVQVHEARKAGASGVLLIAAMLSDTTLREMLDAAWQHGMFVLLESFDEDDLERSSRLLDNADDAERARSGQLLVGVNTRNLRTLEVDNTRLQKLGERLPTARCVAESGLRDRGRRGRRCGAWLSHGAGGYGADAQQRPGRVNHGDVRRRSREAGGVSLLIKVCGLSDPRHVETAIEAGADALGFVFAESPRSVTPEDARSLSDSVPRDVKRVAVMLHPSNDEWQHVLAVFRPDVLQTDAGDFAGLQVPESVECWPVFREGVSAAGYGRRLCLRRAEKRPRQNRGLDGGRGAGTIRWHDTGRRPACRQRRRGDPIGATIRRRRLERRRVVTRAERVAANHRLHQGGAGRGENCMSALPEIDAAGLLAAAIRGELPDERGRFGPFGGRYVPETLVPAFERLEHGVHEHLHEAVVPGGVSTRAARAGSAGRRR